MQVNFQKNIDNLYVGLNRARMQPLEEAVYYQQSKRHYNGYIYRDNIKTRQGVNALQNLLTDLKGRSPVLNKLKWSFALHMVADQQAIKLGENGLITTQGTFVNQSLPQRCKKYSVVRGRVSQVYEFGSSTADQILESLLIDDGLVSRKRRRTLLDPVYNYIGVGTSFHDKYGIVTVIILAEDVISLVSPGDEGNYIRRQSLDTGKQFVFDILQKKMNQQRTIENARSDSFHSSVSYQDLRNQQNQPNAQNKQNVLSTFANLAMKNQHDPTSRAPQRPQQQQECTIY